MEFYCDNKSTIVMAKNLVYHSRTKHITMKYHFLREVETKGEVELKFCSTKHITKALPRVKFRSLSMMLGV